MKDAPPNGSPTPMSQPPTSKRTLTDAAVERLEYLARLGARFYARLERQHGSQQETQQETQQAKAAAVDDATTGREGERA